MWLAHLCTECQLRKHENALFDVVVYFLLTPAVEESECGKKLGA
jgi:hypothetical protein